MSEAALFALSDRSGAVALARAIAATGRSIVATSGTAAFLREAGIDARDVESLTGFPPLFDGRVKTLHPKVFGAILADRENERHRREIEKYAIPWISIVVANLYPFETAVARAETSEAQAIEEIDVGGVALLRAGAKNFHSVCVLSDPSQYDEFSARLREGWPDETMRRAYARAAFVRTSRYDRAIAEYFERGSLQSEVDVLQHLRLDLPLAQPLRYGENPQNRAAFYRAQDGLRPTQLHGKALSYNNLLDLDATLRLMIRAPIGADIGSHQERFVRAAIVKHTVPCGVAQRSTVAKALGDALAADPISAYGGIVAADAPLDGAAAASLAGVFLELVAAPAFDEDALDVLRRKKNLRIMRYDRALLDALQRDPNYRSAIGGVLQQQLDETFEPERWRVVSRRSPGAQEWHDLAFAWDVVRHLKSNGVVVAKDGATRGICAGQTNRVSAVELAGVRAGQGATGAACASDGYFPFPDGLEAAAHAGCTAVIAPSGSIRDGEVIAAADRLGIALIFSNRRYFLH